MKIVKVSISSATEACVRAFTLQEQGEYDAAAQELSDYWDGPGADPNLAGLLAEECAELLLLSGTLSGQIGSSSQIKDLQEHAKNLLTKAGDEFTRLGDLSRLADTRSALAVCYWRSGAFDEARAILRDVLGRKSLEASPRLRALITLALVEEQCGRSETALAIYADCAELCNSASHYLIGTYHMNFSLALKNAKETDRALIEATAAIFHLEQCGHRRYQGRVLNNTAMLLLKVNRLTEAQQKANRAAKIFQDLGDIGTLSSVLDTKAQIYLAEGKPAEAERVAGLAVKTLSRGDEKAVLVDAMKTHAIALLKLGRRSLALNVFTEAHEIAVQYLSESAATKVLQTLIEELVGPTYLDTELNLERAVDALEARIIKESLILSNGRITEAAFRLRMSHQALDFILNGRQQQLLVYRAPKRKSPKSS